MSLIGATESAPPRPRRHRRGMGGADRDAREGRGPPSRLATLFDPPSALPALSLFFPGKRNRPEPNFSPAGFSKKSTIWSKRSSAFSISTRLPGAIAPELTGGFTDTGSLSVSPIAAPRSAERVTANHLADNERGLARPRSRVSPVDSVYALAWFCSGV